MVAHSEILLSKCAQFREQAEFIDVRLKVGETEFRPHLRWPTRDMLQTKKDRCKQKRCAANKNRSLQTKKMRCKQKTIAANKKDALQTKNDRCKQKRCAANKKRLLQTKKGCAANKKRCGYMAGNRSRFSKY